MANVKISALPAATTPLAGTEELPIVQSAQTVKATVANINSRATLQQVTAGVNKDLTNGRNLQGTDAGNGNTGNRVNAIGGGALKNNTGNDVNALGQDAGVGNSFASVNFLGNNTVADADQQTVFGNFDGTTTLNARLSYKNISDNRKYELPDASGTLVLSVNGTPPDAQGDVTITVSPTLQQVTTAGNTTTDDIISQDTGATSIKANSTSGWGYAEIAQSNVIGSGYLGLNNGSGGGTVTVGAFNITGTKDLQLPNQSGTLVATVNNIAPDTTGNVVLTGGVQTAKISLTSANILGLNGSGNPFLLLAAPGASKFLNVLSITARFNFVTTAYSTNTTLNYCLGLPDSGGLLLGQATSFLGNSFNVANIRSVTLNTTNITGVGGIENQGLYVYCNAIAPTLGDSTVDIYVTYMTTNI